MNILEDSLNEGYMKLRSSIENSELYELEKFISEKEWVENDDENIKIKPKFINNKINFSHYNGLLPRYSHFSMNAFKNKIIQKIVTNEKILSIIKNYFNGNNFRLLPFCQFLYSHNPNNITIGKGSQLYHTDPIERDYNLKLFFLLSDVDELNGPTTLIKNTKYKFTKGGIRYPDSIENNFNKNDIVKLTGKKGDCYLVCTEHLHKGGLAKKGYRLLFHVHFEKMGDKSSKMINDGWRKKAEEIFGENKVNKYPNLFEFSAFEY